MRGMLRTFPVKPTSPKITISVGTIRFFKLDTIATAIDKSQAGSFTLSPPITLTYTSLLPNVKPQRFSKTANKTINRLRS